MTDEVADAMKRYFRLKTEEEGKKLSKQKGIVFSREGDMLLAKCPDEMRCSVDIEIQRGEYADAYQLGDALLAEVERLSSDLIQIKQDLIYGLVTKEDALVRFQDRRASLREAKRRLDMTRMAISKTKVAEDALASSITRASQLVNDIKAAISLGDARAAAQIYADSLAPELADIQEKRYAVRRTAFNRATNETRLVQDPVRFSALIVPVTQADTARILADIK